MRMKEKTPVVLGLSSKVPGTKRRRGGVAYTVSHRGVGFENYP